MTLEPPHFFVRKSSSSVAGGFGPRSPWTESGALRISVGTWWFGVPGGGHGNPHFFTMRTGGRTGGPMTYKTTKNISNMISRFARLAERWNLLQMCVVVAKLPKALATAYCPQEQQERNLKRHWDYRVITVLGQRSRIRCVFWSLSMLHWIFSRLHWIAAEVLERFHVSPDARIGGAICFAFWVWS